MMRRKSPAVPATANDVARLAKVSIATVSRTINQPEAVREELRMRVLKAIRTLGYIPNAGARALMLNRSGTIGVIVPTLTNTIFAQGLTGFQQCLSSNAYQVLVGTSGFDPRFESEQILNMVKRGVEAVALTGNSQEPWILELMQQRGLPYCHVICDSAPFKGNTVGFANDKAIRLVADHLIALGHREIGVLSGITRDNDRAAGRVKGIRDSLLAAGLELPERRIIETTYDISSARTGLSRLLEQAPEITAVVCGIDLLAHGAVLEAQHRGLNIPRDLSIAGFDDLDLSAHSIPGLTTVRTDPEGMWRRAAEVLLQLLRREGQPPRHSPITAQLIVRGSTSPLRSPSHPQH